MGDYRLVALLAWSGAGMVIVSLAYGFLYHALIVPVGGPVSLSDVLVWQIAAWLPAILLIPAMLAAADRIALRRHGRLVRLLRHATVALAAMGIHGLWYAWVSTHLSPYVTLQYFDGALYFYLRWNGPLPLAVYGGLAIGTARATSSLPTFGRSDDGLLRTASRGTRGPDWSALLEAMHGPVLVYDPGTLAVLAVNGAALTQYGWSSSEFRKMTLADVQVPGEAPGAHRALQGDRDLPMWRAHEWHRRSDGRHLEVELTNHPVLYGDRRARMMVVNDLTAAEEARRALAESERKFRSIFENALVGLFQSSPDGRFLTLNEAAARMLGFQTPAAAIATVRDISALYLDAAHRAAYLDALRREGMVSNWRSRIRTRDGSVIWVTENARAIFEDDELSYIEGTVKDITDEVAAQDALRDSERRTADLRLQLAQAQLRALKLQLKPHFLFNILNTVGMMIRNGDTDKAQSVVTLLGEMFRRFLEFEGEDMVSLRQELSFVDLYFGLEQFRFEDRMVLERDLEDGAMDAMVPILILQPIVENAVKHGLARMSGRCRLGIAARVDGDRLVVEVHNDVRAGGTPTPGYGIGVRNTVARLREIYGGRASFELVPNAGSMTARLTIPMEEVG